MTRLITINFRCRHWLVWIALLVPFAAAAFASIPHLTNAKYGDYTYAKDGLTLTNGNNSYTVIATDSSSRKDTNVITANLPSSVSFTYDSNGNLTSDGLRGFDYDDENRLTGITVANTWKTLLIYDGLGRRRGRYEYLWFNGAWAWNLQVEYVYDGNVVVQERWGGDEPWVNYTRGLDVSGTWQGAGGVGGLLAWSQKISGAYQSHYYHSDGNGNVTALINTNQVISARYLYDPYGNLLASSGGMADVNVYRFSSQEFHEKSGLYAYAMRFYEPRLGRWLNGDPLREGGGINMFQFCGGDPINRVDPWGLMEMPEAAKGFVSDYYQAHGTMPWMGWYDTHQNRVVAGWFDPDQAPRYGLINLLVLQSEESVGADNASPSSNMGQWADLLDASGDLKDGAKRAMTFRNELGKEAVWGAVFWGGGKILRVAGEAAAEARAAWKAKRLADAAKALPTPKVTDPKLGNIVNDLFKGAKGQNPIGTGSTADAVRNELTTGLATHGKFHSQKAQEYINALNNWQRRNPNASDYDRLVAESLKRDLQNALGGN